MLIIAISLSCLYLLEVDGVVSALQVAVNVLADQQPMTLLIAGFIAVLFSVIFFITINRSDARMEDIVHRQADAIIKYQSDLGLTAEQIEGFEFEKKSIKKERLKHEQLSKSLLETDESLSRAKKDLAEYERLVTCIEKLRDLNEKRTGADFPFNSSLQEIISLSGSSFGFITEAEEGKQDHTGLRFLAVCAQNSSGVSSCEDSNTLAALGAFPLDDLPKTLIVNNDLHGDTQVGGAPHGHPPLDNIINIPLMRGPNLLGQMVLTNRSGGYGMEYTSLLAPVAIILSEWLDSREQRVARRRIQDSFKRLQRQSNDILTASHDGVITVSSGGSTTDLNPPAESMFELKTTAAKDMNISDFIKLPGLDGGSDKAAEEYLAELGDGTMNHFLNVSATRQNGTSFPVDVVASVHDSGPHKFYRFYIRNLLSGQDKAQKALQQVEEEKQWLEMQTQNVKQEIVESKKMEQRALAQIEKVERTSRTKLELLANMSHELSTPMNSIVGFANILLNGSLGDGINQQERDYIQYISDSSKKLLDYTDGVLDMSGVEEGRMEINPDDALAIGDYSKFSAHIRNDEEIVEALFQRALEIDPGNPVILSNYSLFRTNIRQEHERSEELYKYACEADPSNAMTLGDYAVFLSAVRKHNDRAEDLYKRAIKLDPQNPQNLANYAKFLSDVHGYHDRADTYYKRAIEEDPENTNILGRYAHFQMDIKNDQKQARAWFERALETAPDGLSLRLDYAFFLFDIGDEKAASDLLDEIEPRLYGKELLMAQFYKFAYSRSTAGRSESLRAIRDLLEDRVRCPLFDPFPLVRRMADDGHSDARLMEALAQVITVRDTIQTLSGQAKWRTIQSVDKY